MLESVSADEEYTVVLGSVTVAGEAGPVVDVCSSTAGVLGSASSVGKVKIGSLVGIGRSLVVIKGISLSLMPPLRLFERALIINTTTTTNTITITVIAMIVAVTVVAVFMEEEVIVSVVVVVVEIVEVVASFMEEVMVFVVAVVTAVAVVDVQADNAIDPEESVNMWSFFALDFTQETPQSVCSKDVAPWNIWIMLVTAETSHTDRSWLKTRSL